MEGIGPIVVIAFVVVLLLIMMSGRKVTYFCNECGHRWPGKKHHGATAPKCPKCGSTDVGRK